MASITVNLSGIKLHVGMYCSGGAWMVDDNDTYVVDDAGKFVAEIDSIDEIGAIVPGHGWQSLRCIAEEQSHAHYDQWDRDARRAAAELRHEAA
jgi:hypothetical protein